MFITFQTFIQSRTQSKSGGAENAVRENDGREFVKLTDQFVWHEIAGQKKSTICTG